MPPSSARRSGPSRTVARLVTTAGLGAAAGVVVPAGLVLAGGGLALVLVALGGILVGNFLVRRAIVMLPHRAGERLRGPPALKRTNRGAASARPLRYNAIHAGSAPPTDPGLWPLVDARRNMLPCDPGTTSRPLPATGTVLLAGLTLMLAAIGAPARVAAGDGPGHDESSARAWAFRPPRPARPPACRDAGWIRTPVDAFVLRDLEKNGLAPAPPAGRLALLRRVHFDLIGLPPTPEEVERFLNDDRPDAYERLVDRLLASPHYGERWGRHWLDVARYADTDGFESDYTLPERLALPRLRHPLVQRRQAVRPLRPRAGRRRRDLAGRPRGASPPPRCIASARCCPSRP